MKIDLFRNCLRIGDNARLKDSCCTWYDFKAGFVLAFMGIPTRKQWIQARDDWYVGLTGGESAHHIKEPQSAVI